MPIEEKTGTLALRAMTESDAPGCHGLSQAVGWPHRLADIEMALELGRGVAVTLDGRIVATALWWPFGEAHASTGIIIVSPEHQGRGIGKKLMQGLLAQTGTRSLMLTATPAGEPLYRSAGFAPCGDILQFHGEGLTGAPPAPAPGDSLRRAGMDDLAALERLDEQATGLPRGALLAALLVRGECVLLERQGEAIGYSILRAFGRGQSIGPVVARGIAEAESLIAYWVHHRPCPLMRLDTPAECGLGPHLSRTGWKQVGSGLTMARGAQPVPHGPARRFTLVSQAMR